jgi:hypothetical protein
MDASDPACSEHGDPGHGSLSRTDPTRVPAHKFGIDVPGEHGK